MQKMHLMYKPQVLIMLPKLSNTEFRETATGSFSLIYPIPLFVNHPKNFFRSHPRLLFFISVLCLLDNIAMADLNTASFQHY